MHLQTVPTLHDLALKSGAFMDKADPQIGIPHDCYVFTREELAVLVELVCGKQIRRPGDDSNSVG